VTTVIDGARQQFADSTIRDFVPLLVERRAEEELARQLADDSVS